MTLALVIPVWNDAASVRRLVHDAARFGCIDQVVLVDDGSDPPLSDADLLPSRWRGSDRLVLVRAGEAPQGPGRARNLGLTAVDCDHVLFFDADDRLTRDLPDLLRDLAGRDFDFCLFKHADSRMSVAGEWSQMPEDEALWQTAGVAVGALSAPGPEGAAVLAETANYPWNKIYRTAFLRENAIVFTEIVVHEDVEPHWQSFQISLRTPGRILTSDRFVAVHFIRSGDKRLSNRTGAERLDVFRALDRLADQILPNGGAEQPLALPFLRFTTGLFDWIAAHLEPEFQAELAAARHAFLASRMNESMRSALEARHPALAARIRRQMQLEGGR